MHFVKFTGSGAGAAQGNANAAAHGSTYTLKLKKEAGYDYNVSYRMGGKPAVTIYPVGYGVYEIHNVTSPLEIIIEKIPQRNVSVTEYLTLDKKSVFLVQVSGPLEAGKVFAWDGNAMYYSEVYGTWVYPVITEASFDAEAAEQRITVTTGTGSPVVYSADIDGDGRVDLTDAELVYGLYRAEQQDFRTVGIRKFLSADINGDQKIDVRDVAAILFAIRNRKEG